MTDHLARFTPVGPDAAELLIRMGRASAPTPLRWKLAVAGLLLANAAAFAWIALRTDAEPPPPVVVPVVVPVPVAEPSLGFLASEGAKSGPPRVFDDPDRWPAVEAIAGVAPPGPPLTPLAARRGEID